MADSIEGFWIVQYEGMQGNGGGVVFLIKGRVFGGDSGTTYLGSYQVEGKIIKVRIKVHFFLSGFVSIIGITGDYELDVTGTIEGEVINARGTPVGHPTAGMALRLTKAANLPA